ncbi:MAG: prepilin-type N-terminal cleavage/methylation domain-containing protein [Sulfurospirillum sp.]|nr:prepilin-type N-terminal cleavage/methylation domain-containing protein [Sulfurospirillum sp.]
MRSNSKLTAAFTTIELVFVIIIIAIMASVGVGFVPNYDVENDTNFVLMHIKEQQKNALSYDFTWEDSLYFNHTCIEFSKNFLETLDRKKTYKLNANITTTLLSKKLCFDFLGRPFEFNATNPLTVNLLTQTIDVNISKNAKSRTISVYPMSGFAKIN